MQVLTIPLLCVLWTVVDARNSATPTATTARKSMPYADGVSPKEYMARHVKAYRAKKSADGAKARQRQYEDSAAAGIVGEHRLWCAQRDSTPSLGPARQQVPPAAASDLGTEV